MLLQAERNKRRKAKRKYFRVYVISAIPAAGAFRVKRCFIHIY